MRYMLVACVVVACGPKASSTVPTSITPVVSPPAEVVGLIPPQPTLRLPRNFLPTAYELSLAIDPAKPKFDGHVVITGKVSEKTSVIWLHGFHLDVGKSTASQGATSIPLTVTPKGEDFLEIRAEQPLAPGEWKLAMDYRGELDAVNTAGAFKQTVNNQTYVYSQLEALYARRVFPSFDEPNVKTPYKISLRVPKGLVAVANTPIEKEVGDDKMKTVEFAVSKPMPTYLVAFGVGPFDIVDAGKSKRGTPIRIVTLAGRAADATYAAQTSGRVLDAVEDYFGVPYPYEKLDMLTIPLTVGFGAMENAGLITYSENIMLMDPKHPSQTHKEGWLGTASHEVAHQWFGNFVTPEFWDDIWLNEGFATWLGSKVTAQLEPAWRNDQALLSLRHGALGADEIVSARRVRQPIETVGDIETAFDGITYIKGASVLRMFESYVGEATFQKGIREYMASRAWGNATSADFVASISKASGQPIDAAFSSFLDQGGAPEITVTTACGGGKVDVTLTQRRYLPPGTPEPAANKPWIVPICMVYEKGGKRAEQCTMLDKAQATVALETKTCPRWLMPNVDGRGYYRTAYTVQQITALRDEAWKSLSWTERRAAHFDIREGATIGKVPLQLALSFTPKLLAGNDRFTVEAALVLPRSVDHLISDELRPKYEYWLRSQFAAAAIAVGFTPKDSDTLDIESSRLDLIGSVAWLAREPALVAEAVKLSDKWRDLPESIRELVLDIAVDAKPELFDKVLREVSTEPDRQKRGEMFSALASVRDPVRLKAALSLIVDAKVDIREAMQMPFYANTDATKEVAKQFVKDNKDSIIARVPSAQVTSPLARYAGVFTATCRAEQRDLIADYVMKTFGNVPSGARVVKQAIEGMDQCIANRKILEPELKAWLGGLKLPKPDAKK